MTYKNIVSSNYDDFARQIARIIWGICDHELMGSRAFCHLNENNFNAPCDMLARLGIMFDETISHRFAANWSPFVKAPVAHHVGEPTARDLWLGLTFLIHWFPEEAASGVHGRAVSVESNFSDLSRLSTAGKRYRLWAVQGTCELFRSLNMGEWTNDGIFRVFNPFPTTGRIDDYWSSRNDLVRQLGSEEFLYPARR